MNNKSLESHATIHFTYQASLGITANEKLLVKMSESGLDMFAIALQPGHLVT